MNKIFEGFNQRFIKAAAVNHDRPAISLGGETAYTYGQLLGRAKAVAAGLRELTTSLGPESVVGIHMEKSAEYVATMLGVWFAGAAFVPLDPTLPDDRLEYMCKQAGVTAVVANAVIKGNCAGARILAFSEINPLDVDFEPVQNAPDHLAYIIFTSGSTGRPKGVMVEHRGIINFIDAQIEAFALTAASRSLWMLSTNFDASVSDLGTALLAGANIFIEPTCLLSPRAGLEKKLEELAITHVDMPPSVLRLMDPALVPRTLETIIIGGEACAPDVVQTYARKLRLVNVYGPTESTVCTSLGQCGTDWQRPLIGQPLPGVFYHVLDENYKPVETGGTGELYIGGLQLARGYARREDLTRARFISGLIKDGERLYKTGDIIKLCEDGEYQFVGRSDRQFKLRGMLIEPEEVEARLLQYPGVERAAVLKRAVSAANERAILVAYYTGDALNTDLRQHLKDCLPAWMVPQRLEKLYQMPMTLTGKIDLTALASEPLESQPAAIFESEKKIGEEKEKEEEKENNSESSLKNLLKTIWQNILGVGPQDTDNFFDLGGDSFTVVEAVVAAQARGVNISPALLLANPVFADLVGALGVKDNGSEAMAADVIMAETIRRDIAFSAEQQTLIEQFAARANKDYTRVPQNIFLTGATGFLGARLLHELLSTTEATIYCLVRVPDNNSNNDHQSQINKIARALSAQNLPTTHLGSRVHTVNGRLDAPELGMAESTWSHLCNHIDTIFHSGARVNMLDSYAQLRASNVAGTWEIARLMMTGRPKVLHYASTLSVFVATDKNHGTLFESDKLDNTETIYGGYAQSKWAAEVLLRNLEGKAGPVTFHRLGLITGDSKTGQKSSHDFLDLFGRGIALLGCVPRQAVEMDPELCVDITPVAYAAAAMVKLSLLAMAERRSETYHIAGSGSLSLKRLLDNMAASGMPISLVATAEFKERLLGASDRLGQSAAACLALCRALGLAEFQSFRSMDLFQATDVQFSQTNALRDLAGTGIVCPAPDERLIRLYLEGTKVPAR